MEKKQVYYLVSYYKNSKHACSFQSFFNELKDLWDINAIYFIFMLGTSLRWENNRSETKQRTSYLPAGDKLWIINCFRFLHWMYIVT